MDGFHICRMGMPDYGLDRCDGHHEMSISGSEKSVPPKIIKKIEMRGYSP
jgi:hypothetical protein